MMMTMAMMGMMAVGVCGEDGESAVCVRWKREDKKQAAVEDGWRRRAGGSNSGSLQSGLVISRGGNGHVPVSVMCRSVRVGGGGGGVKAPEQHLVTSASTPATLNLVD